MHKILFFLSGTKLYGPPEAFRRRCRFYAKPATVYSLGVLLYVMLFGRYPNMAKLKIFDRTLKTAEISKGKSMWTDHTGTFITT